ncbi:hypothetical protein ACFQFC_28110 [Amorphoplanes digitatis]|uniref:Bacteriocin biosynthesis cyclodehydratase domain-containing protein n=1 Tax=Actinoplanes digitatis TaxID=1868 RepID=A0A7W7MMJ2_9ACTN|nr:hypothetical protein [Actinoplanes digitatis]MBB4760011.1 bacteriocin biosynthesis cyclodehydratase domain-containing protein [Actinoplanes digitatis]GID95859.1 hypothetical protein Adi01nite_52710 [Actinoplanes digitatis]
MSRTPLPRPTLLPGLPRIWHTPRTLQLGLDPPRAVLIDLPEPSAAGLLDLLDGSRSERLALARAGSFGMRPDEARTLLDTLHAAGLVVPAQRLFPPAMPERLTGEAGALAFSAGAAYPARTLRRRAAARVVVTGRARLAPGVAVALAAAGVGHVHPDLTGPVDRHETPGGPLTAADIGRPRSEAAAEAIQRAAPGTDTRTVRRGAASLVIRLGGYPHPALSSIGRAQRRRPCLAASIREGRVLVGPLVPPATSPCLGCVDLHRRERGPTWPDAAAPPASATVPAEPCAAATLLAATAYLAAEALAFLDGDTPETLGAEVEISRPGRFRRRTWAPHPSCPCRRRPTRDHGP